ncbi:DUF434 domain-containing protein [Candidatus Laterigemmans baculatus]|uniref:DUF434 domain-containing protein n=1 Tax=Candidatus Laterigemmans baculatus TaxID=2770505 RepID=UPI0013DD662A|nr:DUF434 domain-containing protein [Candidatus Laterigemmans baculatus]
MPDHRKHRGPHPEDSRLFRSENLPALRMATRDLSWLLSHGYAPSSSLKLVGDRYALDSRQRVAVARCACGDAALERRQRHRVEPPAIRGAALSIDGFNVLTTIEAALAGGLILKARDGCYRDMASMHGNYRTVTETRRAIEILGVTLAALEARPCLWLLDQPVSNSGRLKTLLREFGEAAGWDWQIELVPDPDPVLIGSDQIVASSDSQIVDRTERWFNLVQIVLDTHLPDAWRVDLAT